MSKEEIKAQFDSVVEQLNGELSKLPESVSLLVNLLIATFNMLFELTASQTDNLKVSIDSLKQTIEQQTQTIENLTRSNQKLVETQELNDEQILQFQELIKSLRTLLHSKNVDLDALKRLLFQGGREQKEQPAPQETTEKNAE